MSKAGARLVLTYQNDRLGENLHELAPGLSNPLLLPCDVSSDEQIQTLRQAASATKSGAIWTFWFMRKHTRLAKPSTECMPNTKRDDFKVALDVSAYSLVATAGAALPLMKDRQSAIVTLTYLGSERVVQNYNVMGVAKAALNESSVRYLANDLKSSRYSRQCHF